MINAKQNVIDNLTSPVRKNIARVELYKGSTLVDQFNSYDKLISFKIERAGAEDRFFGFGICQKVNVKLLDVNRELSISTENTLDISFGCGYDYVYALPAFKVSEIHRDENTNELSVTAYDALYKATNFTYNDLPLSTTYTLQTITEACGAILGLSVNTNGIETFNTVYSNNTNFEGKESVREILDAIAEATQSIYFISHDWKLTFIRLDINGAPVFTIDREQYFELQSKTNRRLKAIYHVTELGDNVGASKDISGTIQYVRDNPFWELRDDIANLVNNALSAVGGLTIHQFNCSWRGNYLLEIGDKVALITKDNEEVISYLLNDTIEYDGSLTQNTEWNYQDNEEESESNPTSLGDVLKQTYARVNKAEKHIDLVASEVDSNKENIATLLITTEEIRATAQNTQSAVNIANEEIATLTNRVEASITAEDVKIEIANVLEDGVNKVETATGFTFNENGLTIAKSNSEIETSITEDGMIVYRNGDAVLTADNEGVKAEDLHATTYLIIGKNSRFEDYGERTGCFWIGGNS